MTVSSTPRLGLTQWSADSDPPINRGQMGSDFADLDALVAIALRGTLAERPPAGTRERLYFVASGASAGQLFWDTGAAWVAIVVPKTLPWEQTFSVPGEISVADTIIPGFYTRLPAGASSKIVGGRANIAEGTSVTFDLRRHDGSTVATVLNGQTATVGGAGWTMDLSVGNLWRVYPVITAVSGAPKHLSITLFRETTV